MAGSRFASEAAPFGRIGARLGLRWIFPIGTMPVPYHPWLALALPVVIAATLLYWLAATMLAPGEARHWDDALYAAAILAIPLSFPLVQWMAYAFRLFLLQALFVLGAMVLLAVDAATGAEPLWLGLVPVAFFGWHAAITTTGRLAVIRLARMATALAEERPLADPAARPILIEGPHVQHHARALLDRFKLPRIHYVAQREAYGAPCDVTTILRVAPDDLATIELLLADAGRKDVRIVDRRAGLIEMTDCAPTAPLIFAERPWRGGTAFLGKMLAELIVDGGPRPLGLVHGAAAPLRLVPIFSAFVHFSLLSTRHLQPQVGFLRARTRPIGAAGGFVDAVALLFAPVATEAAAPLADAAAMRADLEHSVARAFDAESRSLASLTREPGKWVGAAFRLLPRYPKRLAGQGSALCEAFAAARQQRQREAVRACAILLAVLPDEDFSFVGARLLDLLNSKEVARPGQTIYRRGQPTEVTIGLDLLRGAPLLYERLGDLGEPARALILGFGAEFGWDGPLGRARDRLDTPSA